MIFIIINDLIKIGLVFDARYSLKEAKLGKYVNDSRDELAYASNYLFCIAVKSWLMSFS